MNMGRSIEKVSFIFNMTAFKGAGKDMSASFVLGIEKFAVGSEYSLHVDRRSHLFVIVEQYLETIWSKGER